MVILSAIFSLGAVQPSLHPVFVYYQETGNPVAQEYDRGNFFFYHFV